MVLPRQSTHGWRVVAALSLNSSLNAFMCMSFSAAEVTVAAALGVQQHEVAVFYSAYLFAVMLGLTPVMWLSERYERASLGLSVFATLAAAWLRWWSLHSKSFQYELCMISQALVGLGACAVSTLPGQISHQRFGPDRWALTTSLMLMANYAGWLVGSSVPEEAIVEGSVKSLEDFFFQQCIYSLVDGPA